MSGRDSWSRWADDEVDPPDEEEEVDEGERLVVSNAKLDVRLLPGKLVVAFIKRKYELQASWLLLKIALYLEGPDTDEQETGQTAEEDWEAEGGTEPYQPMRAIVLDEDGCTLILGKRHLPLLQESGLEPIVDVAPPTWRALEFSLGHMVAEVPGIINHLASVMASEKISILHHSTYASEIFLVRQSQVSRAMACIRKSVDTTLALLCQSRSSSRSSPSLTPPPCVSLLPPNPDKSDPDDVHPPAAAAGSGSPPTSPSCDGDSDNSSCMSEGPLALKVLPQKLVLVRMHRDYVHDCSYGLTRLLLFDKAFTAYRHPPSSPLGLVSFCELEGEISMLLPEEDVGLFPSKALLACPVKWTPLKLTGRRFSFHETGVVSAMSKVDAGIPILNVSTFTTSVTLVEGKHLPQTLDTLSQELQAKVLYT